MAKEIRPLLKQNMPPKFDKIDHAYYDKRDYLVPSVSSIIEPLKAYENIPIHILQNAAEKGESAHMAIMAYNRSRSLWLASEEDIPHVEVYAEWLDNNPQITIVDSEVQLLHPTMHYAGTLDIIVYDSSHGVFRVVDIKTGSMDGGSSWVAQVSLYTEMLRACIVKAGNGITVGDPYVIWTGSGKAGLVRENKMLSVSLWTLHRHLKTGEEIPWKPIK